MELINGLFGLFRSLGPTWGMALVIVVVGGIVSVVVQWIVREALKAIRFDVFAHSRPVSTFLSKGGIKNDLGELIGGALFYLIITVTLVLALDRAGVGGVRSVIGSLLTFLSPLSVAVLSIFLGLLIGEIVAGIVRVIAGNIGLAKRDLWGSLTQYAVFAFAILLGLRQLNLLQSITPLMRDLFAGAVFFGLALAFGLAGKEAAGNVLATISKQFADKKRNGKEHNG